MSRISILIFCIVLFAGLATSNPTREGRISGADRLKDPEISKCLSTKNCVITYDFRPTCASDGRTYANTRVIDCLNECLAKDQQISIASRWYCEDDAPAPQPISKL